MGQAGEITQEKPTDEALEKKAQAFIEAITHVPPDNSLKTIDTDTLHYMVEHGEIIELTKKSELTPTAQSQPIGATISEKDDKLSAPVYVIPGVGMDEGFSRFVEVTGKGAGDGYLLVASEQYHAYGPDHARSLLSSDADFVNADGLTKAGDFKPKTPQEQHQYEKLLASISHSAEKDHHIDTPTILINNTPGMVDAYAFESKEGHKYLYVSEEALNKALAPGGDMKELKKAIEGELDNIQQGKTSPEGLVSEKIAQENDRVAQAFVSSLGEGTDVNPLHIPYNNAPVSEGALKQLTDSGTLVEVPRSELMPRALSNDLFKRKDEEGKDLPVYVVKGLNANNTDYPEAILKQTDDGKSVIIINEAYHKLDSAYLSDLGGTQYTNADVKQAIDSKQAEQPKNFLNELRAEMGDTPEFEKMKHRFEEILNAMSQDAKNMDAGHVKMLVTTFDQEKGAGGLGNDAWEASSTTKEGANYVLLDKDYLKLALSSDELTERLIKRGVGHEVAHIADKDTVTEGAARFHDLEAAKEAELKAYLLGAGPLGSHDPEGTAKIFNREDQGEDVQAFPVRKETPASNNNDYNNALVHPAEDSISAALQEEGRLMKKYEVDFEARHHHKPKSKKELAEESAAVVGQVLQEYRDNKLPPLESPGEAQPGAATTPQAKIDAVKAALGDKYQQPANQAHADMPTAPAAVVASEATRAAQKANAKTA